MAELKFSKILGNFMNFVAPDELKKNIIFIPLFLHPSSNQNLVESAAFKTARLFNARRAISEL